MPQRLEVAKTYKLFINGAFPRSESGRSLEVRDAAGRTLAHIARASRKDLRDAVEAAVAAQPRWADASAYNRGQVLYRMAEVLQGRRDEFAHALIQSAGRPSKARRPASRRATSAASGAGAAARLKNTALAEVDAAVDRLVCFAGWADKYSQALGCNNPVAGPYYNFTVPEPTGVVGVVAPPSTPAAPPLLGLVTLLAPPLCAGNAVIAIAADHALLPSALFAEVCATSDVPAGAVNILTAQRGELLEHLASHRDVNGISAANCTREEATLLRLGVAENLKRVHLVSLTPQDWLDPARCEGPATIEPFIEFKTIWHPSGA